jgi:RimJ/RimL family protein N-acetyltransferase
LAVDGLLLRSLGPEDAEQLVQAVNESLEHLRPWMQWAQEPAKSVDSAVRLALAREAMDAGGDGSWGMFDATTDVERVIGGCGLHDRVGPGRRDIGYWVHPDFVGHGFATRAAAALTWVGFRCFDLESIEIYCDEANHPSAAIPRRLGYEHVRTVDDHRGAPSNTGRMMVWELTRDRWPSSPAARFTVTIPD